MMRTMKMMIMMRKISERILMNLPPSLKPSLSQSLRPVDLSFNRE